MSGRRSTSQNPFSQNSENPSQNSEQPPYFPTWSTWPNNLVQFSSQPGFPQGFPNNPMQFSSPQGYPPYFHPQQGYPPQFYPPPGYPPQPEMSSAEFGNMQGLENMKSPCSDEDDQSTGKRRTHYTAEESELLAKYWIDISIDSVVGNDQSSNQLWERIAALYDEGRPANTPKRSLNRLKSHFYRMQRQCKWFSECYNRVSSVWGSGKSDADIMEMAQTEYRQHHATKGFGDIGVWRILMQQPKFAEVSSDVQSSKRNKSNEEGAYTSSNTSEAATSRPLGQKAAKRKEKGKGKKEVLSTATEVLQFHDAKSERYLRAKEDEIRTKEWKIMMKDTSNMTEDQKMVHQMICDQIKRKWNGRES